MLTFAGAVRQRSAQWIPLAIHLTKNKQVEGCTRARLAEMQDVIACLAKAWRNSNGNQEK